MPIAINYTYSANPNSNQLLVLLHGLFGSQDNLSVVARYFKDRVNVLSLDLPDHGNSDHLASFTLAQCADAILPVIEKHKAEKTTFLGHSLGGKVGMYLALTHPQAIDNLIVADIAPVSYPSRHDAIIKALKDVPLHTLSSRRDADEHLKGGIPEAGVRQFLLKSLYQNDAKEWRWRFNLSGLADSYENIKSWPDIDKTFVKPVLFIKGGNSDYIMPSMQGAIAALFPNAKAHVIDNVGHWLHAEKPDVFNRVIEKQIQRL